MNISKFTQKSIQAINNLEKVAYDFGNQEIEQEHLLYSLLHQDDSLILKLIEKMEIQKELFISRVEEALRKRTKVQGGQVYIGRDLNTVLVSAEDEAKQMGDEYVSVEHLFLSMMKHPNREIKAIFKDVKLHPNKNMVPIKHNEIPMVSPIPAACIRFNMYLNL